MKSDVVKKGMQTAPNRSLFNALGITEEELERPLVGIVSSYNEIVPGHMNIDKIVEAVKTGYMKFPYKSQQVAIECIVIRKRQNILQNIAD